jgi:hypothetical protein
MKHYIHKRCLSYRRLHVEQPMQCIVHFLGRFLPHLEIGYFQYQHLSPYHQAKYHFHVRFVLLPLVKNKPFYFSLLIYEGF